MLNIATAFSLLIDASFPPRSPVLAVLSKRGLVLFRRSVGARRYKKYLRCLSRHSRERVVFVCPPPVRGDREVGENLFHWSHDIYVANHIVVIFNYFLQ